MSQLIRAVLPIGVLALMTFWCGSLAGATTATGAVVHQVLVLAFCLLAVEIRDPLRLGDGARLLLPTVALWTLVSAWFSPVGRAGLIGLTLLPAYLLTPAATARCWHEPRPRRVGMAALTILVSVVCLTALIRWQTLDLARASLPLGHHNLLAGWLILVLPLTVIAGRKPGAARGLAVVAGALALTTLALTGSFLGAMALATQALMATLFYRPLRRWLLPAVFVVGAFSLPRLLAIATGTDLSALARFSYLQAGWSGASVRPLLGWGPGSVPWTIGRFLDPRPGVQPASHIVGDLHSLPVQLAYELGIPGLLLTAGIVLVFALRRGREARGIDHDPVTSAAMLGLAGGAVFALGSSPLSVPALPFTAAVVAGAAIRPRPLALPRYQRPVLALYLLVAAFVLIGVDRAHLDYDRARRAESPATALELIARAVRVDPAFPLYRARQAWLGAEIHGADDRLATQALTAARQAPGLAPLWLAAGDLGRRAGQPWAPVALARARELDPLSPLVAFQLMMATEDVSEAERLGEFALAEEPRLAGALWWSEHPDLAERLGRRTGQVLPATPEASAAPILQLALTLDREPSVSFSLYAFRRSPWPGHLAATPVRLP